MTDQDMIFRASAVEFERWAAIQNKLYRCNGAARDQSAKTQQLSTPGRAEWTAEDWHVFDHLRIATAYIGPPSRGWAYMDNLNI